MSERADEPVPKLPRGRGMKFSGPQLFRIGLTLVTLIGVLLLTKPCANAVSGFVTSFDGSGSAKEQSMPKPGNVDMPRDEEYEQLTPGMTPEEIKAAMERSKARNAAANAAAQGSATTGSAASGSATTGSAASGSAAQGSATTGSAARGSATSGSASSTPSAASSTPSGTTAPAPTKP